jgi:hypothetical protein
MILGGAPRLHTFFTAYMARQFKPVRFFVLMAIGVAIACGTVAFFNQRVAHGRSAEERAGYTIGERMGREAPASATLPNDAALNMMAQEYFKREGSGNLQDWDLGFENGYADGFKKTHPMR